MLAKLVVLLACAGAALCASAADPAASAAAATPVDPAASVGPAAPNAPATAGAPTAALPPAAAARPEPGEPLVVHSVIEDDGSRVDELRVRGQLQRVVVTPKVGITRSYEIIVGRSGRDPVDGTGGANSAVGKRVWNVLAF